MCLKEYVQTEVMLEVHLSYGGGLAFQPTDSLQFGSGVTESDEHREQVRGDHKLAVGEYAKVDTLKAGRQNVDNSSLAISSKMCIVLRSNSAQRLEA